MYVTSNIITSSPGGDITPRRKRNVSLPSPTPKLRSASGSGDVLREGEMEEKGWRRVWLDNLRIDRTWDWELVAREVGWKLGTLLLLTNAWLFWGIEVGRFK